MCSDSRNDVFLSCCTVFCPQIFTLFPYTTLFRSTLMEPLLTRLAVKRTGFSAARRVAPAELVTSPLTVVKPPLKVMVRSEEHTSELQSRFDIVCRLLLEKKNYFRQYITQHSHPDF